VIEEETVRGTFLELLARCFEFNVHGKVRLEMLIASR